MVWGGICGHAKTRLVIVQGNLNAQKYRDDILTPVALPFLRQRQQGTILQHDNARPHTAALVRDYLNNENVQVLPWPACSPDMNPIEHLWDHLDRQLRKRRNPPANRQELENALLQEWDRIVVDATPYCCVHRCQRRSYAVLTPTIQIGNEINGCCNPNGTFLH